MAQIRPQPHESNLPCVTVARAPSPPISVRSSTPLVQNVSSVFGDTLPKGHGDGQGNMFFQGNMVDTGRGCRVQRWEKALYMILSSSSWLGRKQDRISTHSICSCFLVELCQHTRKLVNQNELLVTLKTSRKLADPIYSSLIPAKVARGMRYTLYEFPHQSCYPTSASD